MLYLHHQVNMACLDLSFISVLKVIPAIMGVLSPDPGAELIVLIKPQFEAGKAQVGTGGVVKDPKVSCNELSENLIRYHSIHIRVMIFVPS